MEQSIRDSDYTLLICTPNFATKSNIRKGGVGYETSIVTGEIFRGINNPGKFVPVLRRGNPNEAFPSYLMSKVFIDLKADENIDENIVQLLRHIHGVPKHVPPPIGPIPAIKANGSISGFSGSSLGKVYCERCGAVPGSPSKCPGWSSHNFVSSKGNAYCERCGAVPGSPSKCPGWSSHNFVSSKGNAYCERCGAVPGSPSQCPGWSSHNFVSSKGNTYCERCGAVPGSPSKCPGWSSHNFVSG